MLRLGMGDRNAGMMDRGLRSHSPALPGCPSPQIPGCKSGSQVLQMGDIPCWGHQWLLPLCKESSGTHASPQTHHSATPAAGLAHPLPLTAGFGSTRGHCSLGSNPSSPCARFLCPQPVQRGTGRGLRMRYGGDYPQPSLGTQIACAAGGGQRKTSCLCTPWIFLWCNKMKDLPKCSNYTGGCACSGRSERCPLKHCDG